MKTKMTDILKYGGALAFGALVVGCGQTPEDQATEEETVLSAALIGTVDLSTTHSLKFWDHGGGLARIEENYHMDLDRDAPLTLSKVDVDGRSFSEVYEMFAGARRDAKTAENIKALDLRVADLARQAPSQTPTELPTLAEPASSPKIGLLSATRAPTPAASADGIEVRQSALTACTEPANDWTWDAGWFKTTYCGNDASFCPTLVGWAETAWSDYLSKYHSAGANQSFCTTAAYRVMFRSYASGSGGIVEGNLIKMTLPVRWVNDNRWTTPSGGRIKYWSRIASTLDNPVSMAIHRTK
jgi:hypothetical protein